MLILPPLDTAWIFALIAAVGSFAGAYFTRRAFLIGTAAFVAMLPIVTFAVILGFFISESIGRPSVHITDYGWDAYLMGAAVCLPDIAICLWVPWLVAAAVVRSKARRRDIARNPSS
jgi:hypothetical protein